MDCDMCRKRLHRVPPDIPSSREYGSWEADDAIDYGRPHEHAVAEWERLPGLGERVRPAHRIQDASREWNASCILISSSSNGLIM